MTPHSIHSESYANHYLDDHCRAHDRAYRMDYWNHFFLDAMIAAGQDKTHLLEEGGGTCGIWQSLSFDRYTSVDISETMNAAARKLHRNDPRMNFVAGDIFSAALVPGEYSAIVANAFGLYYRPDLQRLRRFYDLLAPGGLLFVAIDPLAGLKHALAAPVAGLIDRHVRRYTRFPARSMTRMAEQCGFRVWMSTDYTPADNWHRRAFILKKPGQV